MKKQFYEKYVRGHMFELIREGRRRFKCPACGIHGVNYREIRREDGKLFWVGKNCCEKILSQQLGDVEAIEVDTFTPRSFTGRSLIYPEKDWISVELRYRYAISLIEIMITEIRSGSIHESRIMEFFEYYFHGSDLDFEMWIEDDCRFTFVEFVLYLARSDRFSTSDMRAFFEDCLRFLRIDGLDYEEWKLERKCFF